MGLFSKLKNAVTGGAAEVSVEVGEATTDAPFEVRVHARAASDVKYRRVYLSIQAFEEAVVHEVPVAHDHGIVVESVEGEHQTCNLEIDVDGPGALAAGEEREWVVEVELPEGARASYAGETIAHSWRCLAALDAFGNDPDSGWLEFEVY